jgi:hypothetical protein
VQKSARTGRGKEKGRGRNLHSEPCTLIPALGQGQRGDVHRHSGGEGLAPHVAHSYSPRSRKASGGNIDFLCQREKSQGDATKIHSKEAEKNFCPLSKVDTHKSVIL